MNPDVVIVGGGIAGLTAGIFASRAGLNATLIDNQGASGGVLINVDSVQNFPGFPDGITGFELGPAVAAQAMTAGTNLQFGTVNSISACESGNWQLDGDFGILKTRNVIIATGSQPRKLSISGEEKFHGHGVSYCATCDGDFFRDEHVVIAGGGDAALDEALVLSNMVASIAIIHRGERPTGSVVTLEKVRNCPNITFQPNAEVSELIGESEIQSVRFQVDGGRSELIDATGIFVYVGVDPQTGILDGLGEVDPQGHVRVDLNMCVGQKGLYAVGDIRQGTTGMLLGSAADGMTAAVHIASHR
jgi:thioredoxin reductase (NADPH)